MVIRGPTGRNRWIPDIAIGCFMAPIAVVRELVGVDDDLFGNTFDAPRVTMELVSTVAPSRKVVPSRRVEFERRLGAKSGLNHTSLAAAYQNRAGFRGQLGNALIDRQRDSLTLIHVDAEYSSGSGEDASRRRVHSERASRIFGQLQDDAPAPESNQTLADSALGELDEIHLGVLVHAKNRAIGKENLAATMDSGPDPIAGQDGDVDASFRRFQLDRALEANLPFHVPNMGVRIGAPGLS
jgi:hypothetical protein